MGVGGNPSEGMDIKKDVVDANRGGLPKRAYFGRPRTLSPIASPIAISSLAINKHASNQFADREGAGFSCFAWGWQRSPVPTDGDRRDIRQDSLGSAALEYRALVVIVSR